MLKVGELIYGNSATPEKDGMPEYESGFGRPVYYVPRLYILGDKRGDKENWIRVDKWFEKKSSIVKSSVSGTYEHTYTDPFPDVSPETKSESFDSPPDKFSSSTGDFLSAEDDSIEIESFGPEEDKIEIPIPKYLAFQYWPYWYLDDTAYYLPDPGCVSEYDFKIEDPVVSVVQAICFNTSKERTDWSITEGAVLQDGKYYLHLRLHIHAKVTRVCKRNISFTIDEYRSDWLGRVLENKIYRTSESKLIGVNEGSVDRFEPWAGSSGGFYQDVTLEIDVVEKDGYLVINGDPKILERDGFPGNEFTLDFLSTSADGKYKYYYNPGYQDNYLTKDGETIMRHQVDFIIKDSIFKDKLRIF